MTDDKPDGDDLFEDLDKFFAPIRDVDWESEEPPPAGAAAPQEEHVAVRTSETAPSPEPAPSPPPPADRSESQGEDEDEAWYDTSVLEPIDELIGSEREDEEAGVDEGAVIRVERVEEEPSDQTGFFDEGGADETGANAPEPPPLVFAEEDEALEGESPTEEEMEAAAEHFAGSVRIVEPDGEGEETAVAGAPASIFSDDEGADDLGGGVEEDILADLDDAGQRTVVVGAEGLGGPSWQEPTSVEVGADLDRRGPGQGERDYPAAVLTGVILAAVALGSLLIGKGAFAIVAAIVVLIAQGELFGVTVKHHRQPATLVGLVTGALMIAGAYYHGEPGILAMFAVGVIATFLWFMAAPVAHREGTIANLGVSILNIAYIPLLGSYLIVTLAIGGSDGKALVVAVIGLTFIFDTAAFLVGSVWGGSFFQRPLAPSVSPKKSLEGLIGATLITVIVSMALVPSFVGPFTDKRVEALALAIVVAAAATLGDLAESLIKRDLGIKDMGSVLPGHGGVLDRIDSLLFVAPAAFLLFRVIFA